MGDVIDLDSRRRPATGYALLVPIHWDIPEPPGGPFIAIDAPPAGSSGWQLDRKTARELAAALLEWASDASA